MTQDDPDVKVMKARSKISEFESAEQEIYAKIGKTELGRSIDAKFPAEAQKLRRIQKNIDAVRRRT